MTKNSMVSPLRKVLVCTPQAAGWNSPKASKWMHLGFVHAANFSVAQAQHDELCRQLREAGAEVVSLPTSDTLSLDAVYTHDSSLSTNQGIGDFKSWKIESRSRRCSSSQIRRTVWRPNRGRNKASWHHRGRRHGVAGR